MTAFSAGAVLEHRIGPTGRFLLRMPGGAVRIQGVDGDIARVRDLDGRDLSKSFGIEATPDGLSLRWPERLGIGAAIGLLLSMRDWGSSLEVELPRRWEARIDVDDADVRVDGMLGASRLRTTSGDLVLVDVAGEIQADAVSGDVSIASAGDVAIGGRTVSGDFKVRAARVRALTFNSTSGDLRLDGALSGPGPYEVESISGDVTIVGRGGVRVAGQTVTGSLSSELPHRLESGPAGRSIVVGDGAAALGFRSVSGNLRVVAPRDALPVADAARTISTAEVPARDESGTDARLEILRRLERGEISVAEASGQLDALGAGSPDA